MKKSTRPNKSRPKRKKTDYNIGKNQLNLIEIRRKLNADKIKLNKKHKHCKELHDLEKRKLIHNMNLFYLKKEDDLQKSKKLLIFKPKLDKKSKSMMKNKKEPLLNRMANWLKLREEKIKRSKQDKIDKEEQKIVISMKPKLIKNKIQVVSKVKIFLQKFEENMKKEHFEKSQKINVRSKTPDFELRNLKKKENFDSLKRTVKKVIFNNE